MSNLVKGYDDHLAMIICDQYDYKKNGHLTQCSCCDCGATPLKKFYNIVLTQPTPFTGTGSGATEAASCNNYANYGPATLQYYTTLKSPAAGWYQNDVTQCVWTTENMTLPAQPALIYQYLDLIWETVGGYWWVRARGGFILECPWNTWEGVSPVQTGHWWTFLRRPSNNTDRCDPTGTYQADLTIEAFPTAPPPPNPMMTLTATVS